MKPIKNVFLTALALAALSAGVWAQTTDSTPPPPKKHKHADAPPAVTAADVQALKDALAAQQQQIQALQDELHRKDQAAQQAQSAAADAAAQAAAAQAAANQQVQAVGQLKVDVADLRTNFLNTTVTLQDLQKKDQVIEKNAADVWETPMSIHLKGITITPGGFVAAEFVRRSRELGADLPTPFNSLTMPGASQSTLPEFFGSARQSRPTVFIGGRLKNVDLEAYVSADFLSAGVTSSATQTNSYTLRLRQAWAQAKFNNGWKLLGGQMWSLVTENKAGIAPSDDIGRVNDSRPMTIDPGYNVGFTFARQYGLRATKDFGTKMSVAVAIENAQATLTTHGNADNFLLGEAGASNSYNTTSTYAANPSPDVVAKVAFDPGFGHYEVFGLFDRFADRVFPCVDGVVIVPPATTGPCPSGVGTGPSASGAYNSAKNGGGFGVNARWNFDNHRVVFGVHGFGGSGVGRYGAAQLSDVAINADGTLHLIRDLQGLATLEWHGKKLDLYSYAGAEYAARAASFDPFTGKNVGYGAPTFSNAGCYTEEPPTVNTGFTPTGLANCTGDTRAIMEGTLGFVYRFYNGPKGKFQFGTQYSYVTRETWSGVAGPGTSGSPSGLDNMVFTSFRYYLP
jgi:Spy/CpxP family protein refolding chaperone